MTTINSCQPYATIASDPTKEYMKRYNSFLGEKTKNETITLAELEETYSTHITESMKLWLPVYIHKQDKLQDFQFSDSEAFKQYITDSQWFPGQLVNTLKTHLKFLAREPVYATIKNAIGDNWQEKTILEFAAGKCIHSWLLGDLFKQVISVELQAKEVCIGLKINQILGIKPNVSFYIGDITTCCDELIEKHRPAFLLFQMGNGFVHISDKNKQTRENISKDGKELAKEIANKHNLPYWYN